MSRRILPHASAAVLDAAVLLTGEVAIDETNDRLRIGDGATLGGLAVPVLREETLTLGGDPATGARVTLYSQVDDDVGLIDGYGYGGQGTLIDHYMTRWHWYGKGIPHTWDNVSDDIQMVWRAARNPDARADKPNDYVGTGGFVRVLSATPTGAGGTMGDGNNLLLDITRSASLIFYGAGDDSEWDGGLLTARAQFRPKTGATKGGYLSWQEAGEEFRIGAIDLNSGLFKKVTIAASARLPHTDNAQSDGALTLRFTHNYSVQYHPGGGSVVWTSGAGSPEGVVTAPVGSLYTRTDGGAGTVIYIKESGSGNTGWVAK